MTKITVAPLKAGVKYSRGDEFKLICRALNRPYAQVIRELMDSFIATHRDEAGAIIRANREAGIADEDL